MDANELHDKHGQNLLDQIAADPDFINRPATDPVEMKLPLPAVAVADMATHRAGGEKPAAAMNLLQPGDHVAARPARKRKLGAMVTGIIVLLVLGGGATAYYLVHQTTNEAPQVAIHSTPTPTPLPTASPVPTASPTPLPTVALAPQEVTAPAVAPTIDHPQAVSVTSKSGLWLRSSASSLNQKNVIGWMPAGAQVSVDSTGAFWWHGTYAGKTGYFAVSYTK